MPTQSCHPLPGPLPTNDLDMALHDWIDQRARLLVMEAEQHTSAILAWASAPRNAGLLEMALTASMLAVYQLDVTTPAWGQEQAALARAGEQVREAMLPLAKAWAREQAIDECRERFAS